MNMCYFSYWIAELDIQILGATLQYHTKSALILWFVGCFLIQFFISFWNSQRDWLHFKGIYFSVTVSWRFVLYYFLLMVCHVVFRPFIHLQELQHPCVEQRPWMRRQFSACVTQRRWLPGLGLSAIAERSCYCALCNHALLGECMPVLINDVTVTLC